MHQFRSTTSPKRDVVVTPKTCARCGSRFEAVRREYACAACRQPRNTNKVDGPDLSSRETQIVALIRQAKANKEIAYELCLGEGTVKYYLNRIYKKLQVKNRTELALKSMIPQDVVSRIPSLPASPQQPAASKPLVQ